MNKVRESRFWKPLLERYARSPSIALCRVPELELLAKVPLEGPILDHCCGDGYIAAQAYPGKQLDAGIDLREKALEVARVNGVYRDIKQADASKRLPFDDESFATVINNSAIEHIPDLDRVLQEVRRVLRPGGKFYFNVLNTRFYEWWPLSADTRADYRRFQPFYHAFDEAGWTANLAKHGLVQASFTDYMPRATSVVLAEYDYIYSAFYIRKKPSLRVLTTLFSSPLSLQAKWDSRFGDLVWTAPPGQGAGFLVTATRQ